MQQDAPSTQKPPPSGRGRLASARQAPATVALIATNVAIYALQQLWGGGDGETLVRMGALYNGDPSLMSWQRLLTYGYLHGGGFHIGMNMFALWVLGRAIEPLLGASRFFTVYTLSLLGGGIAITHSSQLQLTVGASGAIFGLLGAVIALFVRRYRQSDSDAERRAIRGSIGSLLIPNILISLLPHVSFLGHLGGFIVGGVYMQATIWRLARHRERVTGHAPASRARHERLLATACMALTFYCLLTVWIAYTPWLHGSSA